MKKLILMLAFAGFLVSSYAQTVMLSEVPAAVTKAFNKTHSKITTAEWSKAGDNYVANYVVDTKGVAVTYNPAGKLQQTEKDISTAALPTPVLKYINENFPNDMVKKASTVTNAKGKLTYAVKMKEVDLAFDSNGKKLN
jgi:hypothetical protein